MSQGLLLVPVVGTVSGLTNNQDINTANQAILTQQSGASAPTTGGTGLSSMAGTMWHDTTLNVMNIRDQGDTAWIPQAYLDETDKLSMPAMNGAALNVSLSGGFRNVERNGTMDTWQRGTSGTITAGTPSYAADGYIVGCTGANVIWAQAAGRLLTSYGLKVTGDTSVTDVLIKQRVQGAIVARAASQRVTVQRWVYNNTGGSITPTITVKHATSLDNWGATATDVNGVSLQPCANGQWTQVSYTFAASASSGLGLEITIDFGNNFSTNGKYVIMTECDTSVTPGAPVGLPVLAIPAAELRPVASEILLNQFYYKQMNDAGNYIIGVGTCTATTTAQIMVYFGHMFASPTAFLATFAGARINAGAATNITVTNLSFSNISSDSCSAAVTVASGLTTGFAAILYLATGDFISFSAEL